MTDLVCVRVADFTDGPFAISVEDGERLYNRIAPMLLPGTPVALSFAGIETVIGAFLIAALGPLCIDFPEDRLGRLLTLLDISADGRALVERGMRNTRVYYANRAAYDAAWAAEAGEDEAVQEVTQP